MKISFNIEKDLKEMTPEQCNAEINLAMEDSKNGQMTKATDLKLKIQKWD